MTAGLSGTVLLVFFLVVLIVPIGLLIFLTSYFSRKRKNESNKDKE